jgi:hypothetical protein
VVTSAVVGASGFIGQFVLSQYNDLMTFDSKNISKASNCWFDTVYCCAPTGNRLFANQNCNADRDNVDQLIASLDTIRANRIVLISTVDTQHNPESPYGANRLLLENYIKTRSDYHIIRLCTLVHPAIKKNVLYDLKNQKFLESINLDQVLQWCKLTDLTKYLSMMIQHQLKEFNLVSEPISTGDIVKEFFGDLHIETRQVVKPYNIVNVDNSYAYNKQQAMGFIKDYVYN